MELEPNPRRLAELDAGYEKRTGAWWVTVIVIGVFLGNLLSFGTYQLYLQWELKQAAAAFKEASARQREISNAERARTAKQHAESQRALEKKKVVDAQLRQTCEFWRQQVRRENTSESRAYRDAACARADGSIP